MDNQPIEINMMVLFKRRLQEQHSQSEGPSAVERLLKWNREFNGKDVSVSLFARLQGRDAPMWNLGGLSSHILQSGGYRSSSREHPWVVLTIPNLANVWRSDENNLWIGGLFEGNMQRLKGLTEDSEQGVEVFSKFESRFRMLCVRDYQPLWQTKLSCSCMLWTSKTNMISKYY
jgi:hypothetical protein